MYRISFLFIIALFFAGCTTIEISEDDAFDNHQTVTPESFSNNNLTLVSRTFETEDGISLDSWNLTREDAKAVVLYFGGNGFLMVKSRPLINAYSAMPVNLILFDYRGYGLSSGEPSVDGIQTDARTLFTHAHSIADSLGVPLYIHGHSMGSFLSSYITEREDPAGYILESPISDVSRWTKKLVPWLLRPFVRFDIDPGIASQNNLELVASITTPLLIIGGTEDNITPFEMAEELYRASASPNKTLQPIERGAHNDLPYFDNFAVSIEKFIFE